MHILEIEVRSATRFATLTTGVIQGRTDVNVEWGLSHRIPQHVGLRFFATDPVTMSTALSTSIRDRPSRSMRHTATVSPGSP